MIRHFVRYWLPVVLICAAIFIQSALPSADVLTPFDHSDKIAHLLVYCLLGVTLCRALRSHLWWHGRPRLLLVAAVAAATLYGITDEWHQSFVVHRTAEWADIAADLAGAAIGALIYGLKRQTGMQTPGTGSGRR